MTTNISWTDETWNSVTGCSRVSEGCRNCYAAALAPRLAAMGQKGYTDLPWIAKNAPENVKLHEDRLGKPLRWKKPRRVFVNSMSDLFHEQVPDEFIARVFAVMALASQHTFQILTKRPERMAELLSSYVFWRVVNAKVKKTHHIEHGAVAKDPPSSIGERLENVWLGTSVEDQRAANERIPHLLRTPATIRFLSCEPLLGPVDLTRLRGGRIDCLHGDVIDPHDGVIYAACPGSIDWIIAGGESGPKHRPMNADWAKSLRDQCLKTRVPFFFKQSSGFRNETDPYIDGEMWRQMPHVVEGVA